MFQPKKTILGSEPKSRPKKLYPELTWKENEEALENLHRYFEIVAEVMKDLESKGKLDDVVGELHLRSQWERRFDQQESRAAKRKPAKSHLCKKRRGNSLNTVAGSDKFSLR